MDILKETEDLAPASFHVRPDAFSREPLELAVGAAFDGKAALDDDGHPEGLLPRMECRVCLLTRAR